MYPTANSASYFRRLFYLKGESMNPKEFKWSEDQQVTVVNPTKDDFKFQVHSKEYVVEAGRMAKMPGYIAWMYVYKLATKMATEAGDFIRWNEEGFRDTYYDKLVAGTDDLIQKVEVQPVITQVDIAEDEEVVDEPVDNSSIAPMKPKHAGDRPKGE